MVRGLNIESNEDINTIRERNQRDDTYYEGIVVLHIHISYSAEMVARNSKAIITYLSTGSA